MEELTVQKARPRAEFTELGRSGLEYTGGWIHEEFLTSLQGSRAIKVYKEMRDNDPIIGAVMLAIINLVRQAEWTVEPYIEPDAEEPTTEAEADARFVEECMHDMDRSWKDLISEIMSMVIFGWSYHEIVYKQRNGGPLSRDTPPGRSPPPRGRGRPGVRSRR